MKIVLSSTGRFLQVTKIHSVKPVPNGWEAYVTGTCPANQKVYRPLVFATKTEADTCLGYKFKGA